MASSYDGEDLFGSGPHRFGIGQQGIETTPRWRVTGNSTHTGTLPLGNAEFDVLVTGRLVAATEAGLWTLREAMADKAVFATAGKVLVDNVGRSFATMWFIEYTEANRVDRGRLWSIGYTALFRDFSAV